MSPWKLQPKAAITPTALTGTPFSTCRRVCLRIASRFSAWLRCRFLRVKASDAVSEIAPESVSLSRKASARSSPLSLNHRAE